MTFLHGILPISEPSGGKAKAEGCAVRGSSVERLSSLHLQVENTGQQQQWPILDEILSKLHMILRQTW